MCGVPRFWTQDLGFRRAEAGWSSPWVYSMVQHHHGVKLQVYTETCVCARAWAFLLSSLEHLNGFAQTNTVRLGSVIPIWAEVEQKSHQPLLLLMDECVAAFAPELHPGSQVYPIVGNKGSESKFKFSLSITAAGGCMSLLICWDLCRCVLEGTRGSAKFFRGNRTSEIVLSVNLFNLPAGVEVSYCSRAMQNVVFPH